MENYAPSIDIGKVLLLTAMVACHSTAPKMGNKSVKCKNIPNDDKPINSLISLKNASIELKEGNKRKEIYYVIHLESIDEGEKYSRYINRRKVKLKNHLNQIRKENITKIIYEIPVGMRDKDLSQELRMVAEVPLISVNLKLDNGCKRPYSDNILPIISTAFENTPTLETLSLEFKPCMHHDLKGKYVNYPNQNTFCRLNQLSHLYLHTLLVDNEGIRNISQLTNLTNLTLTLGERYRENDVKKNSSNLQLRLNLFSHLKKLRELTIRIPPSEKHGPKIIQSLADSESLKYLNWLYLNKAKLTTFLCKIKFKNLEELKLFVVKENTPLEEEFEGVIEVFKKNNPHTKIEFLEANLFNHYLKHMPYKEDFM